MKRLLAFVLVFCVFLSVSCAFADPGVTLCYRMNFYAAAYNEKDPGYFDFDTLIIDVYFMDDFATAYYSKTMWISGKINTTGFVPCTVSKGPGSKHTLSFDNGEKMYFYYDENGEFWLEMENGIFHLLPCELFDLRKDLKT